VGDAEPVQELSLEEAAEDGGPLLGWVVVNDPEMGDEQRYAVRANQPLSVGRARDNDIQISRDTRVSRRHCRIFADRGAVWIEDLNSSNGTLVNSEPVTRCQLLGEEEIQVGGLRLVFHRA